jgi:hypothetical protein
VPPRVTVPPAACGVLPHFAFSFAQLEVPVRSGQNIPFNTFGHRPAARHAACSAAVAQPPTSRNRTQARPSYLTWTSKPSSLWRRTPHNQRHPVGLAEIRARLGTEPFCRYGVVAQRPLSGRARMSSPGSLRFQDWTK